MRTIECKRIGDRWFPKEAIGCYELGLVLSGADAPRVTELHIKITDMPDGTQQIGICPKIGDGEILK